jgi:hypothetical protein
MMVLFASRRLEAAATDANDVALESIRAAGDYPALTAALERAGVTDHAV